MHFKHPVEFLTGFLLDRHGSLWPRNRIAILIKLRLFGTFVINRSFVRISKGLLVTWTMSPSRTTNARPRTRRRTRTTTTSTHVISV
jgi:hypothetical protein